MQSIPALLILSIACTAPALADSADIPFASRSLPDAALAQMRGGVLLPNGLDVALGFDIRTLVDGRLALHTVLSTEAPAPDQLRILVGPQADARPMEASVEVPSPATPQLLMDRRGAGSTLVVTTPDSGRSGTVNVLTTPRTEWPAYAGETEIMPSPNGSAIATPLGAVSLAQTTTGSVVTLTGDALQVQHLIGRATGVVIANTASDRRIDTISTIDVDLRGGWVAVANGLFGVNAVVADAATLRR